LPLAAEENDDETTLGDTDFGVTTMTPVDKENLSLDSLK